MSSINRYGGGAAGIQGTRPTDPSPGAAAPTGGGRTGALAETVRSTVLQGGASALAALPAGRFSDFSITSGGGDRGPGPLSQGQDGVAAFLKTAGERFEGKALADLVARPN